MSAHLARLDVAKTRHHRGKGVLFDNFRLVDRGPLAREGALRGTDGCEIPARNPLQNVNDIKAQIAANEKGVAELRKMARTSRSPS